MIDWKRFKAKIILSGKTIKEWCRENKFDRDRYQNLRSGVVKPTEKEIKIFNSVIEGD